MTDDQRKLLIAKNKEYLAALAVEEAYSRKYYLAFAKVAASRVVIQTLVDIHKKSEVQNSWKRFSIPSGTDVKYDEKKKYHPVVVARLVIECGRFTELDSLRIEVFREQTRLGNIRYQLLKELIALKAQYGSDF